MANNGDVQLQLSTSDAIKKLQELQTKLTALRTEAQKEIKISVVVDTKELDKAAKKIKSTLNATSARTGGQTNSLGMPKVADLTQISKQLDTIAKLITKILSATGHLNVKKTSSR